MGVAHLQGEGGGHGGEGNCNYAMSAAEDMLPWQVARWRDDYGIDGIDLDLEEGAGSKKVNILLLLLGY